MAALPGLTTTSLTKEPTKALVSVSSLVLRNSLISVAEVAMVSALSRNCRLSFSSALASSAAISSFGTRGGWAWRLLKVAAPRLLASDVPTAAPKATLSLDVNVARAGDDYDSGDVQ